MLGPLNGGDPLGDDQGKVETKDHTDGDEDGGDQGSSLATVIAPLQTPGRVMLLAFLVDFVDVMFLHSNVDNSPAQEHEQETPGGRDELAMVPGATLGGGPETVDTGEEQQEADNHPGEGEIELGMGHDPYRSRGNETRETNRR